MGSKSPEGHQQAPDNSASTVSISSGNPPKNAAASGIVPCADDGGGDSEDDDDQKAALKGTKATKKKRKSKKKKGKTQSSPPRVPLNELFNHYPAGQIHEYHHVYQRTTAEEIRHLSAMREMDDTFLSDYRQAAETHRQVRQHIQTISKPGVSLSTLADEIETGIRALVGHDGIEHGSPLKGGPAFPTGLALNDIAAHWTPTPGSKDVILQYDDVLKVDFGVHVNGRIVDSAFTVATNPTYDPLLAAVRAATETGVKEAGVDARVDHISEAIQEVMESYEVDINGRVVPVRAVRGLTGHNILRYRIHGDKQVPFYKSRTDQRMEEGDVFAIETFGSTGRGYTRDAAGVYGYGRTELTNTSGLSASAKSLLRTVDQSFGTLVFSRRYLERIGVEKYHLAMKSLVSHGLIDMYPPLVDSPGAKVAQFEHTILLRPNCKEVISRGDDY